jgi:hypothetical protein
MRLRIVGTGPASGRVYVDDVEQEHVTDVVVILGVHQVNRAMITYTAVEVDLDIDAEIDGES